MIMTSTYLKFLENEDEDLNDVLIFKYKTCILSKISSLDPDLKETNIYDTILRLGKKKGKICSQNSSASKKKKRNISREQEVVTLESDDEPQARCSTNLKRNKPKLKTEKKIHDEGRSNLLTPRTC